jgi:hypothetical protein
VEGDGGRWDRLKSVHSEAQVVQLGPSWAAKSVALVASAAEETDGDTTVEVTRAVG